MKDYYTISEISKLYGIGTDSLRYYEEAGALEPKRGKNNYRLYRLKDVYRLNIIRDLLQLGFSMKQVKTYLDCQNLEHTLIMLEDEKKKIREQEERLKLAEESIRKRMEHINRYREAKEGECLLKRFPDRYCLQLNEDFTRDEEVDFAIKRLQKRHEDKIRSLGDQSFGASLSPEDIKNGIYNLFHSVFFILEDAEPDSTRTQNAEDLRENSDILLPAGSYLTTFYRGPYTQSPQKIKALMEEAESRRFKITGDILELYPIDNRYTTQAEEFVTEIQIRVEKQ
ncbi:MerR family transcriptional regulator [Eisenbergiella porci]|uniref:MerR family transcriptional regulator n=1 Tax=Eisenbergiella porci TaxID=2652274 RepID=UPI002A7F34C7|nr:MerR family transcriptional regulator [Eisenbergiella porci]